MGKFPAFQPVYLAVGSFLPHHDYGRGGRGWRDLAGLRFLLLMNPQNGAMIEKNYGGVRITGTNATVIGDGDGNFIAGQKRNRIVWMDSCTWPPIP